MFIFKVAICDLKRSSIALRFVIPLHGLPLHETSPSMYKTRQGLVSMIFSAKIIRVTDNPEHDFANLIENEPNVNLTGGG